MKFTMSGPSLFADESPALVGPVVHKTPDLRVGVHYRLTIHSSHRTYNTHIDVRVLAVHPDNSVSFTVLKSQHLAKNVSVRVPVEGPGWRRVFVEVA